MERQRERPLEGALGAREEPLVAVGASRFSANVPIWASIPSRAQRGEHLVAAVDLDDVGLPAVHVARRRPPAARPAGRASRSA